MMGISLYRGAPSIQTQNLVRQSLRTPLLAMQPRMTFARAAAKAKAQKAPDEGEQPKKEQKTSEKETRFNYKKMNHYDILGVPSSATDKELKIAFLKLAKKYHPDVYKGINSDHFKRVNEAYTLLKNARKRADYDNRQKIRTNKRAQGDGEDDFGFEKKA